MGRLGLVLGIALSLFITACNKKKDDVADRMICENGVLKSGIFGGQPVPADSVLAEGTVFILYRTGTFDKDGKEEMYGCTGSLIDRNIVLTAAHCVPENEDESKIFVAFSTDPVCQIHKDGNTDSLRSTEKIIKHPDYAGEYDPKSSESDLSMLRFKGEAPAAKQTLQLLTEQVDLTGSSNIIVTGYGKVTDYHADDPNGAILRTATISPLQDSDAPEKVTKSNRQKVLYFDQSHGSGACAGDSGGPTLLKTDTGLFILGVNSAVDTLEKADFKSNSAVTCHQGLRSTSVFAQKDWILATYDKLKTETSKGLLGVSAPAQ